MTKFFTISLLLLSISIFSQESYNFYPTDQESYVGGKIQFYKDFNKILKEKNLTPCADKNEIYPFSVLINADNKINFVADKTGFDYSGSKCAKELSREVAKYMHGWNAATIDGVKIAALEIFTIIPDQLFGNLPENYNVKEELAEYEGGMNEFRKKVANRVDVAKFNFTGMVRVEVTFVVEKDGTMNEIKIALSSGLKEFDEMILRSVNKIKNKWKPATIGGFPVRYRYRLPLIFQS